MPGNTFGQLFRVTTFGESHGPALGAVIDGCPAGLSLSREDIQKELDRRRPGTHRLATQRKETDAVEILSGVFEGHTLGTPIAMMIRNEDAQPKSYDDIKDMYRPGHADYTYDAKYGARDWRGGGRASARETAARVAAGAVAKKLLANAGISIFGFVQSIGAQTAEDVDEAFIEENALRCPDPRTFARFEKEIEDARRAGDSIGGVVEVVARGVPAGLGEPVFGKLSAALMGALGSIPAVKAVEIGDGFACAARRGSENNDEWIMKDGTVGTRTNRAGGIVGGISNGEDIVLRIAFKPPSSIVKEQQTINTAGESVPIQVHGRHDPCVVPRAVPIAEAMTALVLADMYLLNKVSKI